MKGDNRAKLAEEALRLKKAWLFAAAMLGIGHRLTAKQYIIPDYFASDNKWLRRHIEDLKDDFQDLAKHILLHWNRTNIESTTAWFAKQFDAWQKAPSVPFEIGRVHEFERAVGLLGFKELMDCPPYAQILMQGFNGAAIRHPEYHLASDLALLYNLLLDSKAIIDEEQLQKRVSNSEHTQSLARNVILTCFNLLEAFASGLATGWLMENPNAPEETVRTLQGKKPNGREMSLRERFCTFPSVMTGKPKLDEHQPPLSQLFGECKQRRDSFVHCEPGPAPTRWGYVKEEHFHDANLEVARETVDLTCEAICLVCKAVHGKDKPSWLPTRDSSGRFPRVPVALRSTKSEVIPTGSTAI